MEILGQIGYAAALAFSAMGSCFGAGAAGMASIGAWKKCYIKNTAAPFLLIAFAGAPLTQTIYGMILMNAILRAAATITPFMKLGAGILGGIAIGYSAFFQGKAAAAAADAFAETGKGFVNYMIILGLVESIAIFVLVFLLGVLGK